MSRQLIPIDAALDSVESHFARRSRCGTAIYLTVLLLVGCSLASLPVVRVGVSIQSDGIIRPETEKHEVVTGVSGFVSRMAIGQNDRVARGQELLRIESAPLVAEMESLSSELRHQQSVMHDLDLLLSSESALLPDDFRSPEYRAEYLRYSQEIAEVDLARERAQRELDRLLELTSRRLVARRDVDDQQFALTRLDAERASLVQRHRSDWQNFAARQRVEIADLEMRRLRLEKETERYTLAAPVGGSIEELAAISIGSFVQAGQQVAVISPAGDLTAEVFVSPRDVGLIRLGTPARLLIDAFNYNDWGFISGRVAEIASDYVLLDGLPTFRVIVALDSTHLTLKSGLRGDLKKGMTLRARFMVADRTLWQLLRDDIDNWLNPINRPA